MLLPAAPANTLLAHRWHFSVLGQVFLHLRVDKSHLSFIQGWVRCTSSARPSRSPDAKSLPPLIPTVLYPYPLRLLVSTHVFVNISHGSMSLLCFGKALMNAIPVRPNFLLLGDESDMGHLWKVRFPSKFVEEIISSSSLYYSLASPAGLLLHK